MLGQFTVVFYIFIPLVAITTLYTVLFRLDQPTRSRVLALPPLFGSYDHVSGPSSSALRNICDETDWTEGLWLQCHSNVGPSKMAMRGGLSNLENRMQTDLLKYPIEGCPDTLFDTELYRDALFAECPQLDTRVCKNTTGLNTTIEAKFRKYLDPSHYNGTFRTLIDDTIAESGIIARPEISAKKPVRVMYGDPFLAWNYTASAESEVKKDLFKLLKYNDDLSQLGVQVFDSLKQNIGGPVVAIHLRGEADWPEGFGTLEIQIDLYTQALLELRNTTLGADSTATIKDIYVSCGNPSAIRKLKERLQPLGYIVHDKMSLLNTHADILERVEALRFDQRAVTEFESLVHADYFMGILTSSLSAKVAYARTLGGEDDYFDIYIRPGTTRGEFVERVFPDSPSVRGDEHTKLIVLTGADLMDCFP
ncbi:hypothetical protein V492_06406 [Pseudogymnoascus sp. VKM F-4246]|nr:hypothetical protein V492_06406 [Pseudogymnoascus sp. VKM F-4246]